MVMIEAMACGTPVIAFDNGSVPEVIDHGVSGFIVRDEAGAIDAVRRLGTLDRRRIRERFEARFTAQRMAENYLALYARLIAARSGKAASERSPRAPQAEAAPQRLEKSSRHPPVASDSRAMPP
jgi:hypothetical protein